ncbi:hypothetical protein [Actinomadura rupiterrae]|uniref:hypothetical protein n=1 Tax=Actinomadura rupiterrae TaxID=559627 RepID=UPI0020A4E1A3|nr:hypothetical protein [Actinomadura rupiterrae]MCP2341140.1 hypothetical protein [Actinomadura rupiterrae]
MAEMELVRAELSDPSWEELPCGCGRPASHLREILADLASREVRELNVLDDLEGHVYFPSSILAPARRVIEFCFAVLADDVPIGAREIFTELLLTILSGEGQPVEIIESGRDLVGECFEAATPGTWLLSREVISSKSIISARFAFDVLSILNEEPLRLANLQRIAADRLQPYEEY